MKRIIYIFLCLVLLLSALLPLVSCGNKNGGAGDDPTLSPMVDPIDDNYRTFYQIFVGSFSDSNDDTFGDLPGIIKRMDYLNDGDVNSGNDLGVQGIWLSPIFSSPSYHKYDAKDYYQIDWRFGSEDDLKRLADLCEERNVKLILDLAINHTSSSNEWFVKFKEARMNAAIDSPYYDWYTCVTAEEKAQAQGRSFSKIATVDAYYECNFSGDMPELNFDNPAVREEMLNVARHYLELGVDGFRFDAIKYIYYGDTAKSAEFWEWYMGELRKDYPDMYAVGECWSGDTEIAQYYGSMNCFSFAMSTAEGVVVKAARGNSNVYNYANYVESTQRTLRAVNADAMLQPFLSNHDMDRIGGAFANENNLRMAANLYILCFGSPTIYYGEELGVRGSRGTANTDANRRLAMLWGDGDPVKDPIGADYSPGKQIKTTVTSQMADENSLYNYYCRLLAIRHKHPEIARGTYNAVSTKHKNVAGFYIEHEGSVIGLFHNTSDVDELSVDLSTLSGLDGHTFSVIADYIGVGSARLEGTTLIIGPQTSVVLKP